MCLGHSKSTDYLEKQISSREIYVQYQLNIFTLLTKLKVTIVILLVAHLEGVGIQQETTGKLCCFLKSLFD